MRLRLTLLWYKPCCFSNANYFFVNAKSILVFITTRSPSASLQIKGLAAKYTTLKWSIAQSTFERKEEFSKNDASCRISLFQLTALTSYQRIWSLFIVYWGFAEIFVKYGFTKSLPFTKIKMDNIFCYRAIFNWVTKVIGNFLGFALHRSVIGPETRATFSTIRCKIKTNYDVIARVFPRFRQFGCLYFEFSLALKVIFLSSDWLL